MKTVVGIDVQGVDEVASSIETYGTRYTRRLFTNHEIESCAGTPASASRQYAARFAAKEAVLKILDLRTTVPSWKSIEVRRTEGGRPEIALHGEAEQLARQQGISELSLSMSHDGNIAIAAVIAQVGECDSEPRS